VEHTEDIHFVERFRLADPNTLVATQQFTDPGSFVGTAARMLSFTRAGLHLSLRLRSDLRPGDRVAPRTRGCAAEPGCLCPL
jgi:hypothetical protein